jgi:hypothetical protein
MNAIHTPRKLSVPATAAAVVMSAALVVSTATLNGCGDDPAATSDAADTTDTSDIEDLTGKSVYRLETTFNDAPLVLDRDLSGNGQYFAFGSTHIAPAVSFAMTDSVTFPRTMIVTLNFGIVVPSDALPIQTDSARVYAFSASPPSVGVFVGGLQYSSKEPGATGQIDITAWSIETGEPVSGTFSGTLVAEGPTGRTLPVSGTFYFTLPEKNAGQPQGPTP